MDPRFGDPLFLQRTLSEYAQGFAALAGAVPGPGRAAGPAHSGALQQSLAAGYQRLFTRPDSGALPRRPPRVAGSAAAFGRATSAPPRARRSSRPRSRWMRAGALQRRSRRAGPQAPPITSLRELHALWIECGEAAYGEAARREEFAAAQAELLMALVELRAVPA